MTAKAIKSYMRRIGRRGGWASGGAKAEAARRNAELAREALRIKRDEERILKGEAHAP